MPEHHETSFAHPSMGHVHVVGTARAVRRVSLLDEAPSMAGPGGPAVDAGAAQLREYLAGARRAFTVPLDPEGTPFQRRVWTALAAIPYGSTVTYGAIAEGLGDPAAVRAVGAANGRNPLAILVPCHRVVGADGTLTGYAGGLHRKRWLLAHERRTLAAEWGLAPDHGGKRPPRR